MDPSSPPSSDGSRRNSPRPPVTGTSSSGLSHRPRVSSPTSSVDTPTAGATGAGTTPIPDEEHGADLPLTMSASVVLTGLPRDAHQALADAEAVDTGKGN